MKKKLFLKDSLILCKVIAEKNSLSVAVLKYDKSSMYMLVSCFPIGFI